MAELNQNMKVISGVGAQCIAPVQENISKGGCGFSNTGINSLVGEYLGVGANCYSPKMINKNCEDKFKNRADGNPPVHENRIWAGWIINFVLILIGILIYRFINKDILMQVVNRSLPPREAGLLAGIILGDKGGFDKEFYKNLQNSGLVHLVVVSGSNVMLIVGGLIEATAKWLSRKRAIIVGITLGWWYTNLVGWEIPVVRAMILLSILYWAQLLGRKFDLGRGIILGVLVMFIGEVSVLTSASFWLSITAFLAVVIGKKMKIKWWLETVWVGVWITPILGLIFGKISLISPVANILVLGMVEAITVVGVVGIIVGANCNLPVLWIIYPALRYLAEVVNLTGKFPVLEWRFNWPMLVGWYLILFYFLIKYKNGLYSR